MSWLQPTKRDTDYFVQLQAEEHEQLCCYAQVLAMAARIDPHLLRSLRLRFLPDSSAELELALWFSDVISSRNATGADMYPGVARLLCDELRVDAGRYEQVKGAVKQLTQHWRAAEQLEQTMRWAVLEEDTDTLQQSYQRVLYQLQTTNGAFEKREIARWAKGALATTLDKEQPLQEATWLYQYVAAALGSPGQWLEKRDVEPLPDSLRMALPEGRTQRIGIRVYPGVLQFVKPDEGDLDVIEVNLPLPTSIQIRFDGGEQRWESVWYGRVLQISEDAVQIKCLMLDGENFEVGLQSYNEYLELISPFDLIVESEFRTVESYETIRLRIDVTSRIDESDLEMLLVKNRGKKSQDIIREMRFELEQEIQRQLYNISLKDYYMSFVLSMDDKMGVEDILRDAVKFAIGKKSRFNSEVIRVVFTRLDNGFIRDLKVLTSRHYSMNFELTPSDDRSQLKFEGEFRIDGIGADGWEIFRRIDPSSEEICQHLMLNLKNILRNYTTDDLVDRSVKGWSELKSACEEIMQIMARKSYGLEITLLTIGVIHMNQDSEEFSRAAMQEKYEGDS